VSNVLRSFGVPKAMSVPVMIFLADSGQQRWSGEVFAVFAVTGTGFAVSQCTNSHSHSP